MGFGHDLFTPRHPFLGISIAELESEWKQYEPQAKSAIESELSPSSKVSNPTGATPVPNSSAGAPTYPAGTPAASPTNMVATQPAYSPSSGFPTSLLVIGLLAAGGAGAYYAYTKKLGPFKKGRK